MRRAGLFKRLPTCWNQSLLMVAYWPKRAGVHRNHFSFLGGDRVSFLHRVDGSGYGTGY